MLYPWHEEGSRSTDSFCPATPIIGANLERPAHCRDGGRLRGAAGATAERVILRARAAGEVSVNEAFARLHALYSGDVLAFLALRIPTTEAEDLAQDVWTIFYVRFRRWEYRPEMEASGAKPVLSFLYRTCQYVVKGFRRRRAAAVDADAADSGMGAELLLRSLEAGRCIELARRVLSKLALDVMLAKLAGVPAREVARTLGISESAVDHRFRASLALLRTHLHSRPGSRLRGRQ